MITKNQRLSLIFIAVPVLLAVPFIAMQFSSEVDWNFLDFLIMGVLLLGTGLLCELVLRKVKKTEFRILLVLAVLAVFFLVWAELAVGIFGTIFAGS